MNVFKTIVGLYFVIDGAMLSAFGHDYIYQINFKPASWLYSRFLRWQLVRPEWLMRAIGAVMSSYGLLILRSRGK